MWRARFFVALMVPLGLAAALAEAKEVPKLKGRTDHQGLPLPDGALARFGTPNLRHDGAAVAAFAADGKQLISAGADKYLVRWSLDTGFEQQRLLMPALLVPPVPTAHIQLRRFNMQRVGAAAIFDQREAPCTQVVALAERGPRLATPSKEGISVWDTASGQQVKFVSETTPGGGPLALSPDGRVLAFAGMEAQQQFICVWDLAQDSELYRLKLPEEAKTIYLRFSPDGRFLAGLEPILVRIWDFSTGKRVRQHSWPNRHFLNQVQFSPDSRHLLVTSNGSSQVRVYERDSDEEAGRVEMQGTLSGAVFLPGEASMLTFGGDHQFRVWNWKTGAPLRSFDGPMRTLASLVLSPDGRTVAAVGADGVIHIFDVATGREKLTQRLPPIQELAYAVDGNLLFLGDQGKVEQVNLASKKVTPPFTFPKYKEDYTTVSLSARAMSYWIDNEKMNIALLRQDNLVPQIQGLDNVHKVVFSPDGLLVAVFQVADGSAALRLFRVHGGKELGRLQLGQNFGNLVFSADNRTLVLTVHSKFALWEIASGKLRTEFKSTPMALAAMTLSPDGKLLAGSGYDETVRVWDVARGQPLWGMVRHAGTVNCLAFTPDGKKLISAGEDGVVRVWDPLTGSDLGSYRGHAGAISAMALAPDGRRLATASQDTTILLWDLAHQQVSPEQDRKLADLKQLWHHLEQDDAARVFGAMMDMAATRDRTVAFLRTQLAPAPPVKPGTIERLIADLNHEKYAERDKAAKELVALDLQAEPFLIKALEARPGAEMTKRLQQQTLLLENAAHDPKNVRLHRAMELLERIGTPSALQLLQELSRGAPHARITRLADEAARRLKLRLEP